jgi:hypothetical protein
MVPCAVIVPYSGAGQNAETGNFTTSSMRGVSCIQNGSP